MVRFNSKMPKDKVTLSDVYFIWRSKGQFLLSKAHKIEASNRNKVKCHGWVMIFQKKRKYIGPIKDFSSMKLKAFSEWGKHHITIPISHMRKQEIGNKRRGWNFPQSGCPVLAALVWHEHHSPPPGCPQLHLLQGCSCIGVSNAPGVALSVERIGSTSQDQGAQVGASLHEVTKVTHREAGTWTVMGSKTGTKQELAGADFTWNCIQQRHKSVSTS